MASEEQGESLRDRKTREFEEDQEQHEYGYCSGCGGYKPSQLDGDGLCYDCRKQQCQGCGKEFQPEELDANGLCQKCSQVPRCQECGRASALDENGLCANCKEGKEGEDKEDEDGNTKEKGGSKNKNGQVGLAPEHASQIADGGSKSGKQGARYGQENYYDIEDESQGKKPTGSEQGDDEEEAETEAEDNKNGTKNQRAAANTNAAQTGYGANDNAFYQDPNESAAASAYKDDIGRDDQGNLVGTGLKADAVDGQYNSGAVDYTGRDQFGGGQHQNMGAGVGQEDGAGDADETGKRGGIGGIQNTKSQEADPKGVKGGQDQGQPPPEGWFRWLEVNWRKMVINEKTKALCTPINQAVHKAIIATAVGAVLVVYPGFNTDTIGALFNLLNDLEDPLKYSGLIIAGVGPFLGLPLIFAYSGLEPVQILRNTINHVLKFPPINMLLMALKRAVDTVLNGKAGSKTLLATANRAVG